jgi:hypothetical protein
MSQLIIKLTDADFDIITEFAGKRCKDGNFYKKRGNFKVDDIIVGAAAEIGAFKALRRAGLNPSEPDFEIYSAAKKSFSPDLVARNKGFHVKGQKMSSAKTYGYSWILQKEDPIVNIPIPGHYFIFCTVDLDAKTVYIHSCIPIYTIWRLELFGKLKIDYLNKTKVAIYLAELEKKLTQKQLWSVLYEYVKI